MTLTLLPAPEPTTFNNHLQARDLEVGDILMIAGKSVFSRLVRLIENCNFDHVAIVVPPNPDHPIYGVGGPNPCMNEIWITDIGFPGGRWQPLSAYDDTVLSLAVRRHRIPGWRTPVAMRSIEVAQATPAYAWDQLLFLTLVGAPRWTQELRKMRNKDANAFVRGFYELIGAIEKQGDAHLTTRRVCSDLITESCAVSCARVGDSGIDETYYGLVTPTPAHHGLLWWAAGMDELAEFLYSRKPVRGPSVLEYLFTGENAAPRPHGDHSEESDEVTFPGQGRIPTEELQRILVTTAAKTFGAFLAPPPASELRRASAADRMVLFLLDQSMKHRIVTTPADIVSTPSLYDAGTVDVGSIRWQSFV
jgi:hypothetical protein